MHILSVFSIIFEVIMLLPFTTFTELLTFVASTETELSPSLMQTLYHLEPKKGVCQWNQVSELCRFRGDPRLPQRIPTLQFHAFQRIFLCYPLHGDSIKPNMLYYCIFLFYTIKTDPVTMMMLEIFKRSWYGSSPEYWIFPYLENHPAVVIVSLWVFKIKLRQSGLPLWCQC